MEEVERRLLTCAMPGTDVVKAYGTPLQVHTAQLTHTSTKLFPESLLKLVLLLRQMSRICLPAACATVFPFCGEGNIQIYRQAQCAHTLYNFSKTQLHQQQGSDLQAQCIPDAAYTSYMQAQGIDQCMTCRHKWQQRQMQKGR